MQLDAKVNNTSQRIAWIDIARGVGILLVVLGHLEKGVTFRMIYAFHMPFFFFLSGYVHKVQNAYASFLRKRSVHLLLPYLSFLLLFAPLELHRASHEGKEAVMRLLVDMLWGGDRLHGDYGVVWFVTCLFATQQVANWLVSKFSVRDVAIIGSISICLAYVNSQILAWFTLPFDLNIVFGALPFYLAGYITRRLPVDQLWLTCISILGVAATVWLSFLDVPISYDMRSASYGVPFLSLILAICCIFLLIRASKLISRVPGAGRPLEIIGAASMGIMYFHKPISSLRGFDWLTVNHPFEAFLAVTLVSYIGTAMLSRSKLTRAFFLGSNSDFESVIRSKEIQLLK